MYIFILLFRRTYYVCDAGCDGLQRLPCKLIIANVQTTNDRYLHLLLATGNKY